VKERKKEEIHKKELTMGRGKKRRRRGNQFWNSGRNSTEKKSRNKSKARQRRVRDGSGVCVFCHLSRRRSRIVSSKKL